MINARAGRWWAAGALALAGLVIGVDGTVLNLALPTLAVDLHANTSQLQWFVDAYLLVLGAMMLPAGLLGDRFGRKRLLLAALVLFGVGSLACAYATSVAELIAARALLGLAAAFVLPLSMSIIPVLFTEAERQRALALIASSAMAAYPLGPLLGGWLLTRFWWGSVFLINVPLIAVTLVAVGVLMPESRSASRPRLDPLGALLSVTGLLGLTYGVIDAGQYGWGSAAALALMLGGAGVLAAFVVWERRLIRAGRQPMVELDLFRSASFSWGTTLTTLMSFVLIGLLFAVPQYLRAVLGVDAMGAGLRLLPLIGGMIVGLGLGDRLSGRIGPKATVVAGFAVTAAGLFTAATTAPADGTGFASGWLAAVGIGVGLALPPAMNAALGRLTGERSGVGSALISAVRQVGGTFGVAVLGALLNSAYAGRLPLPGLPAPAAAAVRDSVSGGVAVARRLGSGRLLAEVQGAFVHGMDVLLASTGVIALAGALLALSFLPGERRREVEAVRPARADGQATAPTAG